MSNVASTLLPFLATMLPVSATMSNKISSFRQSRNKLNVFNLFRHCRKDEISFDIVAKNGNTVEATFDTVERIVQLVAFDNVASTLLLVWTGLKRDQPACRMCACDSAAGAAARCHFVTPRPAPSPLLPRHFHAPHLHLPAHGSDRVAD